MPLLDGLGEGDSAAVAGLAHCSTLATTVILGGHWGRLDTCCICQSLDMSSFGGRLEM